MDEQEFTLTAHVVFRVPVRYRDGALLSKLAASALECDMQQAVMSAFTCGALQEMSAHLDEAESGYYTLSGGC